MIVDGIQGGWRVVLATELGRIWTGWRGPLLLFVFSLGLSAFVLALAFDTEINVLSQRNLVDLTVQATELTALVAVMLLGADSISGERDHRTLESLLLTPLPRYQFIVGKLLAILSLWLSMVPIAAPYVLLVANGSGLGLWALLLLVFAGSLLVGLGALAAVIVSALAPSNLVSFAVVFGAALVLAAPLLLPATVRDLPLVHALIVVDPVTAVPSFQSAVLDGEAVGPLAGRLVSPVAALLAACVFALRFIGERLQLSGGLAQ